MIKKIILIISCLGLLWGCAGMQPQTTFEDNTFTCDFPKVKVRILKTVVHQTEKSTQAQGLKRTVYSYQTESGLFVGITIWRFRHDSSKEWRSSDEQLVRRIGASPLGPITINNKTWIKFIQPQKEYSALGYFKRMDYNLVAVYTLFKMEQYKDDIESFAKTRVLSEQLKQIVTKTFSVIDKLFVIG